MISLLLERAIPLSLVQGKPASGGRNSDKSTINKKEKQNVKNQIKKIRRKEKPIIQNYCN
jgi:hypothetical protein